MLGSPVPDTYRWSRARVQATNRTQRSRCRSWACAAASSRFRGDRRGRGNQALLDADDRDGLELQALHRVHGAGPDGLGVRPAAQRDRRDAVGLQRLARLAHQAGGPGRHADGMRLDAGGKPRADSFG